MHCLKHASEMIIIWLCGLDVPCNMFFMFLGEEDQYVSQPNDTNLKGTKR